MHVTKAYLSKSEEVCSKTLNQCVSEVQELRSLLLPEWPEKVFEEEIRVLRREEKQMMPTEAGVILDTDAKTGLAMKAALGMPWNELRTLRR